MSQSWTWPRIELSDGAVEAMKWLGLILMTADHAQKYGLMPTVPGVYEAGRVAFPLFGIVLAYNFARGRSHDRARYVRITPHICRSSSCWGLGFRTRHDTESHEHPEGSVTIEADETSHDTVRQGSPSQT